MHKEEEHICPAQEGKKKKSKDFFFLLPQDTAKINERDGELRSRQNCKKRREKEKKKVKWNKKEKREKTCRDIIRKNENEIEGSRDATTQQQELAVCQCAWLASGTVPSLLLLNKKKIVVWENFSNLFRFSSPKKKLK